MSTVTDSHSDAVLGLTAEANPVGAPDTRPSSKRYRSSNWTVIVGPILVLGIFVLLWEYMHRDGMRRFFDKPGFLLPSLVTVIDQSFLDSLVREQMLRGLGWTMFAAFIGLAISIVLGISIATLMAQASWIERSLYPYLVAAQAIPVLAVVPLINSVFGGGMGARIFVCVMISIFPIVTNTLFGLISVERPQHELFTLRAASRWTRLRKLQFPSAMPSIFVGFRISAGLSVIGAVVGEQFFRRGQKPGIGVIVEQFRQKSRFPQVYGGLILASLLGIAVFFAFGALAKLVIGKWHESDNRAP